MIGNQVCLDIPVAAVTSHSVIMNLDDLDPISLEPVEMIRVYWDFVAEASGRTYRYDAWAWLEMFVWGAPQRKFRHPVFAVDICTVDRRRCYDACCLARTAHPGSLTQQQRDILTRCESRRIRHTQTYTAEHRISSINIYPESPLLDLEILEWWRKWDSGPRPQFAKGMNCQLAIQYRIYDADGGIVGTPKLFL
jgi:hypothetical protein